MYSFMSKHFDNNNIINNHVITLSNICGCLSKHKYTQNFRIMKKCIYWLCSDMITVIT